jgi:hypothetical protein
MSSSVLRRMLVAAMSSSVIALGVSAVPVSAQTTQQSGLVNVALVNTNVQVPVAVAADICGVQANVIATNAFGGNAACTSATRSTASNGGGGGGNTSQQGLVNVALVNTNVQIPVGVAADVCGVAVNVITSGTFGGNALCSTISQPGATA